MAAKILLLDIETSPNLAYVWGMFKQNISPKQVEDAGKILCWSAKWHGARGIMFGSVKKDGEVVMLKKIHALLDEADIAIHYNGKKFDIPVLNREFIIHEFKPPSPYKQIDLYTTAKSQFRFISNKLDSVAKTMGLAGKVKHEGFDLWLKCMAGDRAAWRRMEKYNKQDVRLLEDVYNKMRPWIRQHPNMGLYETLENLTCASCGSEEVQRRGYALTGTQRYARFTCNECGSWGRSAKPVNKPAKQKNLLRQST